MTDIKEILTLDEAADFFGVSVKTFIKLLREERVPARKIGREWRFSRTALVQWLGNGDSVTYAVSENETREFFNHAADQWEQLADDLGGDDLVRDLLAGVVLKPESKVVDFGCGDGRVARWVAPRVGQVTGVDLSASMLAVMARKAADAGIRNVYGVLSEDGNAPVADASADVVLANMVLHHSPSPEETLAELARITKSGGVLALADFMPYRDPEFQRRMHDRWPGFDPVSVRHWLPESGWLPGDTAIRNIGNNRQAFVLTARRL